MAAARGRGGSHFQLQHEEKAEKGQHPSSDGVQMQHSTFDAKLASADASDVGEKRSRQQQKSSDQAYLQLPKERQPLDHCSNTEGGHTAARKVSRREEPLPQQDWQNSEFSRLGPEVPAVPRPRDRRPLTLQPLVTNETSDGDLESNGDSTFGEDKEYLPPMAAASVPDTTTAAAASLVFSSAAPVRTGRAWTRRLPGQKASPCQGNASGIHSYSNKPLHVQNHVVERLVSVLFGRSV